MGSFNTACFVTKQGITPYDEVFLIPVIQNIDNYDARKIKLPNGKDYFVHDSGNNCYSTRNWKIIPAIINAYYEDCGKFVVNETLKNKRILSYFLSYMRKNASFIDEDSHLSKNFSDATFENKIDDFVNFFSEVDVYSSVGLAHVPAKVSFAVISKHTMNAMLDHINDSPKIGQIKQELDFYYEKVVSAFSSFNPDPDNKLAEVRLIDFVRDELPRFYISYFEKIKHEYDILEDLWDLYKKEGASENFKKEFFFEFEDIFYLREIVMLLDEMNISIEPCIYSSQDTYGSDVFRKITDEVNDAIEEEERDLKNSYSL